MKLSREELKKLIKECLIEIMVEGIGTENGQTLSEASAQPRPRPATTMRSMNVPLTKQGPSRTAPVNPVRALFGGMKVGDTNLASILEQTTTQIPSDMTEGFSAVGEPVSFYENVQPQDSDDPVSHDDGGSTNWANAAFSRPRGFNPLVPPPPAPLLPKLSKAELDSKVG